MLRSAVLLSIALASGMAALGVALPAGTSSRVGAPVMVPSYVVPLPGPLRVVRAFSPPVTRYGPGHLGVDLRAEPDALVRAAGAGVVRFAGAVAGRGVVVIVHPDGISTEYEPVRPTVSAGSRVAAGQPIGVIRGRHRGCPGVCLHWGARRGEAYLDPLDLLRALGPVVLLPWSGAPD